MELCSKGDEACNTACKERKNGVCRKSGIVDTETFANDDICRISNEEHHAGCVGSSEFGHQPCNGVELTRVYSLVVWIEEDSPR